MADKLMYIPNDKTQNYPYCRLHLVVETIWTINEPTTQNSLKVQKVVKPTIRIRKRYHMALGISVIKRPISLMIIIV